MNPSLKQHALAWPTSRDSRRAHSDRDPDSLKSEETFPPDAWSEIPASVTTQRRASSSVLRFHDCR